MLYCAVIITDFSAICKKLISLGLHDRSADLPQAHLRDVAGGDAEGVDGGRCVELVDMGELIRGKIIVRVQAQPGHQHIRHADLQRIPVEHFQIEVVQLLQQTVLAAAPEVLQIVRDIVRRRIVAGGAHRFRKAPFFGQVPEGSFQRLNDSRFKGRLHGPNRKRTGKAGGMGVRNIKIELQAILPIISEHGDAFRTAVDPAAKLIVPPFHFEDCGGVRALGVDQNLLVKGALVVIAGRAEEARPALIAAGDALHSLVI